MCRGYYYARPMPIPDYEKLIAGVEQKPVRTLSANHDAVFQTVWAQSPQLDLLFESIRQPVAIYEFTADSFRALRVNRAFNEFFGYGSISRDSMDLASRDLPLEQLSRMIRTFRAASEGRCAADCEYRLPCGGGQSRGVRIDLQYWGTNEKSSILFAEFSAAD